MGVMYYGGRVDIWEGYNGWKRGLRRQRPRVTYPIIWRRLWWKCRIGASLWLAFPLRRRILSGSIGIVGH